MFKQINTCTCAVYARLRTRISKFTVLLQHLNMSDFPLLKNQRSINSAVFSRVISLPKECRQIDKIDCITPPLAHALHEAAA